MIEKIVHPIIKKKCKALCFIYPDTLLVFKNWKLYLYNISKQTMSYVVEISTSYKRKICSKIRLLERKYGLDTIQAVKVNNDIVVIYEHRKFYRLSITDFTLTTIKYNNADFYLQVLQLSLVGNNVFLGEYGYNPEKHEMSLYRYAVNEDRVYKVYTFAIGEINHIHNIIFNEKELCYYVFTGDFGNSVAIYAFDQDFKFVKKLAQGDQKYRACQALYHNQSIYYISDTPFQYNYIYSFDLDSNELMKYDEINGSCIDGVICNKNIYFSSTVENETVEYNNSNNNYKYNLGKGIKNWFVCNYYFNVLNNHCIMFYKQKKDIFPMMPFKYGMYSYANNADMSQYLAINGVAVRKDDGRMLIFNKKDICELQ